MILAVGLIATIAPSAAASPGGRPASLSGGIQQGQAIEFDMSRSTYSYEDVARALAGSPVASVERARPDDAGTRPKRGLLSWRIKVTLTRSQMVAIIWGGAAVAGAIIAVINPIAGVIAAGVTTIVASLAGDALTCENYKISFDFLLKPTSIECA